MDLGEDQFHLKSYQTPDPHQEETPAPEVIGTWNLRNRQQLRKRKAEAQEKQTSQWALGEQKKRKWQRTGKGNQRGRKRHQNEEPKVELQSRAAKGMREEAPATTEKETEPPGKVTETPPLVASPRNVVPEEHSSEICQESITYQENSSEYQEIGVQNHFSEACQHMMESEDLAPKMCQETAVLQGHPSKECQHVAPSQVLAPKTCLEVAVIQDHPLKIWKNRVQPDVPAPNMCQETALPKASPSSTSEDVTDAEGCSPKASLKPEEPKGKPWDTYPNTAGQEETTSGPHQVEDEDFFPKTHEIAVPKDLSTKTYDETVEPEYFSHQTYKEMPKSSFHKTIQETPGPEEYSPEIYQETPEPEDYCPEIYKETLVPEDLSTKIYKTKDVPKEQLPEPREEMGGLQGHNPKACQEDAKDDRAFPQAEQNRSP
ncbi:hemogen [Ctenodactylus gundi]